MSHTDPTDLTDWFFIKLSDSSDEKKFCEIREICVRKMQEVRGKEAAQRTHNHNAKFHNHNGQYGGRKCTLLCRYASGWQGDYRPLTIALDGTTNAMPVRMRDVRISEHGNWRHLHWGALYSAYGKSPYFDYIADDLHSIIGGEQTSLLEFNTALQNLIIDFLDLPIEIETKPITPEIAAEATDLRGLIGGKKPDTLPITDEPYYQVWASRHGFQPGLSILDLLMNTGRESIYTLQKMLS